MEDFQELFNKAVQIKNAEMSQKRVQFEQKPLFIKAGLYYWPKFEAVRQQAFFQRYFAAELLKSQGNTFFKKSQYDRAVKEYEQALSIFRFIRNKNKNWRKEGIYDSDLVYYDESGENNEERQQINQLKLAIYHNLASGYLQLKKYQAAYQACNESLKIDPKSNKALFRRAKSIYLDQNSNIEQYKNALNDLKLALEINPKDQQIQDLYLRISQDLQNFKQNESQTYKNMFAQQSKSKQDLNQSQETQNELNEILKAAQQKLLEKQAQQEKEYKLNQQNQDQDGGKTRKYQRTGLKKSLKRGLVHSEQESQTENEISTSIIKGVNNNGNNNNYKSQNLSRVSNNKSEISNLQNYWKMFKLESEITNDPTFTFENNYELDPYVEIPKELDKFGKILNLHGSKFIRMLKEAGKYEEARDVQIQINKQKEDKNKLEKLICINLEKPSIKLQQVAQKYGVDLYDKDIKDDLELMKIKYLKSIKKFIKKNDFEKEILSKSGSKHTSKIEEKLSNEESSDESIKRKKNSKKQAKSEKKHKKSKRKNESDEDEDESSSCSSSESDSDSENFEKNKKKLKGKKSKSKSRQRGSSTPRSKSKISKKKKSKKYNTDFEDDQKQNKKKSKKRTRSVRSSSSDSSQSDFSSSSSQNSESDEIETKSRKSKREMQKSKKKEKRKKSKSKRSDSISSSGSNSQLEEQDNIEQLPKKNKKNFKLKNKYRSQTDNENDYSQEEVQGKKKQGVQFKSKTYQKSKTDNEDFDSDENYKKNNLNKYFTKDYKSNKRKQYNDKSDSSSSSDSDKSVASHHTSKYKKGRKVANQEGKKYHLSARSASSSSSSSSEGSENENEKNKYRRKKFDPKKKKKKNNTDSENDDEEEEIQYKKKSKKSGHLTDVNDIEQDFKEGRRGVRASEALALPEDVKKKHKKSKKEKKQEKKLKKKEKKDPLAPTPYAPFGFSKDGRPLTSVDDPEFNMSYYHPDMEVNYCNPNNDPTVQISTNNKHNNLVEDFTTRGSYYRLQYDPEEIKLENKEQMFQTKDLIYQKNDQELYEVSEKEENYTTSLVIFVSIGFFLVTLIYYFFNQSTEISEEQTQENMIMGAQKLGLFDQNFDFDNI